MLPDGGGGQRQRRCMSSANFAELTSMAPADRQSGHSQKGPGGMKLCQNYLDSQHLARVWGGGGSHLGEVQTGRGQNKQEAKRHGTFKCRSGTAGTGQPGG